MEQEDTYRQFNNEKRKRRNSLDKSCSLKLKKGNNQGIIAAKRSDRSFE